MNAYAHEIVIDAGPVEVFALIADARQWPRLLSPCLGVRPLRDDGDIQVLEITARAGGTIMTWTSERHLDRAEGRIDFRQLRPQQPVTRMQGVWRCERAPFGRCRLVLTHEVWVSEAAGGRDDNLRFICHAIERNSRHELRAIKLAAERPRKFSFDDAAVVSRSIGETFDLLADAAGWPALLEHCLDMDVLYDDGSLQELVMTVETAQGAERIRTVRRLKTPTAIDYFQPQPPGRISLHRGSWELVELDEDQTRVTSRHTLRLDPDSDASQGGRYRDLVRCAISTSSRATLSVLASDLKHSRLD